MPDLLIPLPFLVLLTAGLASLYFKQRRRLKVEPMDVQGEWLAIRDVEAARLSEYFQLECQTADWSDAKVAYPGRPIVVQHGDWVLVLSSAGFQVNGGSIAKEPRLLQTWSKELGTEVQFLVSRPVASTYGWFKAAEGTLRRAHFEVDGKVLVSEGSEGAEEADARARIERGEYDEYATRSEKEALLLEIAGCWSVDPSVWNYQHPPSVGVARWGGSQLRRFDRPAESK